MFERSLFIIRFVFSNSVFLWILILNIYFDRSSFYRSVFLQMNWKKNSRSLFLQVCRYLRPLYFYRSELTCVYLIGISLQGLYLYKYIGLCFYRWLTFFFLSLLSLFQLLFFLNSKMRLAGVVCLRYFSAHFVDKHFFFCFAVGRIREQSRIYNVVRAVWLEKF